MDDKTPIKIRRLKDGDGVLSVHAKERGFGVAPVLYMLGLIGVGAGILFSSYSQTIRTNIAMTNSLAVKGDLDGSATTLAATSVLGATDPSILCPPQGGADGVGSNCANAPVKMTDIYPVSAVTNGDVHLPGSYAGASGGGTPVEVGVFTPGSGTKQLDPWGHYYIYCRWESAANSTTNPAIMIISAGPDGTLQTNCGATTASGDDTIIRMDAANAVNRSSVWQTGTAGTSTPEVYYGSVGHQLTVDANGNLTVPGDATVLGNYSSPSGNITLTGGTLNGNVAGGTISGTTGAFSSTLAAEGTSFSVGAGGTISATSGNFQVNSGGAISAANANFTVSTAGDLAIGTAFTVAATGSTSISNNLTVTGTATLGTAGSSSSPSLITYGAVNIGTTLLPTGSSTPYLSVGKKVGSPGTYPFYVDQAGNVYGGSFNGTLNGDVNGGSVTASSIVDNGTLAVTGNYTSAAGNITLTGGTVTAAHFVGDMNIGTGGATFTGVMPIANGGTGASDATTAISNLTSGVTNTIPGAALVNNSVTSSQLNSTGVAQGTYNSVTVGADGRVTMGTNVVTVGSAISDGSGELIATGTTGLTFEIGSSTVGFWNNTGLMVGTGSPTASNKLDVDGGMAIGTSYAGVDTAPANGLIVVGSVGIGTSSPTAALEVNGTIKATSFVGSGSQLTNIGTTSITGVLAPSNGGTGTGTTFTQGSIVFAGASGNYAQDNANFFWDDANARLSIGTNVFTGNERIHVKGGDITTDRSIQVGGIGGNYGLGFDGAWTEEIAGSAAGHYIAFNANSAEQMRLGTNGLSIGTTTTGNSKLQIYQGEVQVGSSGNACSSANAGAIRFSGTTMYYCDGVSTWQAVVSNGGSGGALGVSGGGTGQTSLTAHSVVLGEGTSPVGTAGPGAANTVLIGNGATSDPSFSATPTLTNITLTGTESIPVGTTWTTSTASQNDVALGAYSTVRFNGTNAVTFTGIAAGSNGQILYLHNPSAYTLTLSNQNASSSAANRIVTGTGSDLPIPANTSVTLQYDGTSSLWRVTGSSNAAKVLAAGSDTQVQFNNNGAMAGSSGLVYDYTNSRVGIGSASPGAALDVVGTHNVTSNSATAFTVGANGSTNPAFAIDSSTASSATGIVLKSAATGGITSITATDSGSNGSLSLNSKAAGNMTLNVPGAGIMKMQVNGIDRLDLNSIGATTVFGYPASSGTSAHFQFGSTADTSITASTEAPMLTAGTPANTRTHLAGNISLQRDNIFYGLTDAWGGTGNILTNGATLGVTLKSCGANGTCTNESGIYIPSAALTGTITNSYGINIAAATGATNNYAAVFTGGNVGIGSSNPGAALTVTGTAALNFGTDYSTTGANQVDVALNTASLFRYTGSSNASFSGIVAGVSGQILTLMNATANVLTLNNQDSTETTLANRIITGTGANMNMPANTSVTLQYDGTSARWRVTGASTAAVAQAAGADTQIQYNANGVETGSSGLVYDYTNGRVGIGTTAPVQLLHVYGASSAIERLETTASSNVTAGLNLVGGAANANWYILTNRSDLAGANDNLAFYKNAGTTGTKLVIQDNGNVGIGTTTPAQNLTVVGSTGITGELYVNNNGTGTGSGSTGTIQLGDATVTKTYGSPFSFNAGLIATQNITTNGGNFDVTGTHGYLTEIANDTTTGTTVNLLAKLNATGTKAILAGTSDTDGMLGVVVGGAGTSGNAQIAVAGQASCVFDNATTAGDFVTISSTTAGDCHDSGATRSTTSQNLGRVLVTNASSGGTNAMKVEMSPNPAASGGVAGTGTANYTARWINSTSLGTGALYDNGTNVGIGTTSPSAPLSFSNTATDEMHFYDGGATARLGVGVRNSEVQFYLPGTNHWSFNSGGDLQTSGTNELVRITGTGQVGIGTTSPGAKFVVVGSSAFVPGTDYSTTGANQADVALNTASLFRYTGAGNASFAGIVAGTSGQILTLMNASSSVLTLNNQDTANESTLANRIITGTGADMNMPANTSVTLQYDGTSARWRVTGASTAAVAQAAGSNTQIQYNNNGVMSASSSLVYDFTNTYVGIATANPGASLQIGADLSFQTNWPTIGFNINAATTKYMTTNYGALIQQDYTNGLLSLGEYPSGTAGNSPSGGARLYLLSTGNIGVGTSSPGATLTVNGTEALLFGADYSTTGTQSDVAINTASAMRYTGTAAATFRGIVAGTSGQILNLHNASAYTLTLDNEDTGDATLANRIITGTGANLAMAANSAVTLQYDGTTSRWRIIGGSGGGIPAGTTGQVQYNSGSNTFAAESNLTWDTTNKLLSAGTGAPTPVATTGTVAGVTVNVIPQAISISAGSVTGGASVGAATAGQLAYYSAGTTIAGTPNLTVVGSTTNVNGTLSATGSTTAPAAILTNIAEPTTVSATAATGTINFYPSSQSVLYYTSNASANWTMNFAWSSGTTMNAAMTTGQSVTVVFMVTQGSTAYYNNAVQVDGTTSGVTTKWQGGAPSAGNASGIDIYQYTIIKTGSATYTVLASQTQYK